MNGVGCPALDELKKAAARGEQPEEHRDEALGVGAEIGLFEQPGAQLLQRLAGARRPRELAAVHGGPQHVLGDERDGHRFDALAGDVADREGERARGAAVVVDEVAAAEHPGAGRAVREGDVETLESRRLLRQQAALQALGDVGVDLARCRQEPPAPATSAGAALPPGRARRAAARRAARSRGRGRPPRGSRARAGHRPGGAARTRSAPPRGCR